MKKFAKWFVVSFVVIAAAYSIILVSTIKLSQTPEEALQSFYANEGAEDMLSDPLVLAGDKVVPLVINEVRNKQMQRRRYAITFLGNGPYLGAIPVLEEILNDDTEKDYFRGDALLALYRVSKEKGLDYAKKYKDRDDYLGRMCKEVFDDSEYANKKRSYFEAMRGWHE